MSGLFWHQAEDRARSRIPVRTFLIIVAMMGQKYQKETVFTNWGGDFYFYTPALLWRTPAAEKLHWPGWTGGIDWVGPGRINWMDRGCIECVGPDGKKEAQIEIQAVAKIQYPIKSHTIHCKLNSTLF